MGKGKSNQKKRKKTNQKRSQKPNESNVSFPFIGEKSLIVRFLGLFALLVVLFYVFYNSRYYEQNLQDFVLNAQANWSGAILRLIGYPIEIFEDRISLDDFMIQIKGGCDGLEATALFILAILAFPVPFRLKIKGILGGLVVLAILNILRIVGLFLIGVHYNAAFDFLHLHGGVVLFTLTSIILWLVWVNWSFNHIGNQQKLN